MDKVIDIEERIPTLRERRRKRTNRKFLALLFFFLFLLVALIYSQTSYSKIQMITVDGELLFPEAEYVNESTLHIGDSMWSFNTAEVKATLSELEWVKEVTVNKNWLTGVEISVDEFTGIGFLENEAGYQKLLSNGYALELPVKAVDGPVLTNFKNKERRLELSAQLKQINPEVSNMLSQLILTEGDTASAKITIYMTDGNEIRAKLNSLAEKLDYYPSLVAQLKDGQKGVFDMEVGITFRSYDDVYGPPKEVVEDEESEQP